MKNIKKSVRQILISIGTTREELLSFFEKEGFSIQIEYNKTEDDPYNNSGSHPSCNCYTDWNFYEDIEQNGDV